MMKSLSQRFPLPSAVKTVCCALALACAGALAGHGQSLPKTTDINEDIFPDGSIDLGFEMAFDAAPWRQWKSMVATSQRVCAP